MYPSCHPSDPSNTPARSSQPGDYPGRSLPSAVPGPCGAQRSRVRFPAACGQPSPISGAPQRPIWGWPRSPVWFGDAPRCSRISSAASLPYETIIHTGLGVGVAAVIAYEVPCHMWITAHGSVSKYISAYVVQTRPSANQDLHRLKTAKLSCYYQRSNVKIGSGVEIRTLQQETLQYRSRSSNRRSSDNHRLARSALRVASRPRIEPEVALSL